MKQSNQTTNTTAMEVKDDILKHKFQRQSSPYLSKSRSLNQDCNKNQTFLSKYYVSKRRVIFESDSDEEPDEGQKFFDTSHENQFNLSFNINEKTLDHQKPKSLPENVCDNVMCNEYKKNESFYSDNGNDQQVESFVLPDCSSSSSSSSFCSLSEKNVHNSLQYNSRKSDNSDNSQQKQNESNPPSFILSSRVTSTPLFPSNTTQSYRMGVHGTTIQSPKFNEQSRNWFQKRKVSSSAEKRERQSPNKRHQARKQSSIRKKTLKQTTIPMINTDSNMNAKKNPHIDDTVRIHETPMKHNNKNYDHVKQPSSGNDANPIFEILEIDDDSSHDNQIQPLSLNNEYSDGGHESSTDDCYGEEDEKYETFSNNSDIDEEYHNSPSLDIIKQNGQTKHKTTITDQKDSIISIDDKACSSAGGRVSISSRTRAQRKKKSLPHVQQDIRRESEYIRVYDDLWMKSSMVDASTTDLTLQKSNRRKNVGILRNDLCGGSGVGMGGITLFTNDYLNNDHIEEDNSEYDTSEPTNSYKKTKSQTTNKSSTKEINSRYKYKRSYKNRTKSSTTNTTRKGKGKGSGRRRYYKKRKFPTKKNSTDTVQNTWSSRERGFGCYKGSGSTNNKRGKRGNSYMEISRQDPQLRNDGGAKINF